MKTCIIFTVIVMLTACNANQKSSTVKSDSASQTTLALEERSDPFERLKDFTIDFYSPDYENLIKEFISVAL